MNRVIFTIFVSILGLNFAQAADNQEAIKGKVPNKEARQADPSYAQLPGWKTISIVSEGGIINEDIASLLDLDSLEKPVSLEDLVFFRVRDLHLKTSEITAVEGLLTIPFAVGVDYKSKTKGPTQGTKNTKGAILISMGDDNVVTDINVVEYQSSQFLESAGAFFGAGDEFNGELLAHVVERTLTADFSDDTSMANLIEFAAASSADLDSSVIIK